MRDFFEFFNSRLRTPLLGNFLIGFLLVNWQSALVLVLGTATIEERIGVFQTQLGLQNSIFYPAIVSLFLSIIQPFLRLGGAYLSYWPEHRRRLLQLRSDTEYDLEKKKIELEQQKVTGAFESELIERAKRTANIEEIEDDNARLQALREVDNLRSNTRRAVLEGLSSQVTDWSSKLSGEAKKLLVNAAKSETRNEGEITVLSTLGGTTITAGRFKAEKLSSGRELADLEQAISQLTSFELIRDIGFSGEIFRLTSLGYDVADELDQKNT